jgi:hypothetical protein
MQQADAAIICEKINKCAVERGWAVRVVGQLESIATGV